MRVWLGTVALGALLVSAACDSSTDIPGGRYYRSFAFQRTDSVQLERITPNTGFRTIILNGMFEAPTTCQDLKPQIEDDARNLLITITATAQQSTCQNASLGYFHYNVVMGSFFPGAYRVEVVHKDSRGSRPIYTANVTVNN